MLNLVMNGIPAAGFTLGALTQAPDDGVIPSDQVEEAVEATVDTLRMVVAVGVGAIIGVLAGLLVVAILRIFSRRADHMEPVVSASARRIQTVLAVVGAWLGFRFGRAELGDTAPNWFNFVDHMFLIAVIVLTTWVLSGLINGLTVAVNDRMAETSEGRAARVKTQTQILRRLVVVVLWILGIGAVMLTFPGARAAGASIFASAGIVSVVVGLAAQTTLGNVFAGLQLAFTDSIRVGDIVHYNGNYTTVEEITLTYVVLAVWDGRRIIVPSTIMTTESFENWTRRAPEMTGDVLIKVDWQIPIDAARLRLEQILADTDLWDGRTGVLQINDASTTEGVLIRCLVSAENSPTLTDLRNHVREEMVRWIQEEAPQATPHLRLYDDEKRSFFENRERTESMVNQREAQKPPIFEPEISIPISGGTRETEIISDDDVERLRRVPLGEQSAGLDGKFNSAQWPREVVNDLGGDTAEVAITQTGPIKSAIFSGSPEAEARAKTYSGPGDKVYEERRRRIEETRDDLPQIEDDQSEDSEETS